MPHAEQHGYDASHIVGGQRAQEQQDSRRQGHRSAPDQSLGMPDIYKPNYGTRRELTEYATPPIQRSGGSSCRPAARTTVPIRARGFRLRATTSGSRAALTMHSTPQYAARAAAFSFDRIPPRPALNAETRTDLACSGDSLEIRSLSAESR